MITVKHKFRDFQNKRDIQILILGTFNPDIPRNDAIFFYGRGKNYLWNLLPKVFGYKELKHSSYSERMLFMEENKIGFVDLIHEIYIENGREITYSDKELDKASINWNDFESFINKYPEIKKVYLTRKTFSDIPKMENQIGLIKEICHSRNIAFFMLPTPARYENQEKLNHWKEIFSL